jgi:hypothetical protein
MHRLSRYLPLLVLLLGCELVDELNPGVPEGPVPETLPDAPVVLTDSLPLRQASLFRDERQQIWVLTRNSAIYQLSGGQLTRITSLPDSAANERMDRFSWAVRDGVVWYVVNRGALSAEGMKTYFYRFANGAWQAFPALTTALFGFNFALDGDLHPLFLVRQDKSIRLVRFDGQRITEVPASTLGTAHSSIEGIFQAPSGDIWLYNTNGRRRHQLLRLSPDLQPIRGYDLAGVYSSDARNEGPRFSSMHSGLNGTLFWNASFGSCSTPSLAVLSSQNTWQTLAPPQFPDPCSGIAFRQVVEVRPGEYLLGGDGLFHYKNGVWTGRPDQFRNGTAYGTSLLREDNGTIWYSTSARIYRVAVR